MNRQSLLAFQDRHKRVFTILNWSVPALLGILIFCRPFPYTTAITNISFYLAIFIALVLIIFKQINFVFKTPLTYPLIIFLLWSALSIFWSLDRENSINDVQAHLLNHIMLYFLLVSFFYTKKRFNSLAWIVVASATIFSIAGMVYYYIIMDSPITTRFGTLLKNSVHVSVELPGNAIGTLTITAIFICLYFFFHEPYLYRRVAIISCALVAFVATLLTHSRGTLVSLIIAGTILLLIKNKKLVPFFLVAMVVIVTVSPLKSSLDTTSLSQRLKINYVAMEVLKDYPILGIGFGMLTFNNKIDMEAYVKKVPEKYRPTDILGAHNWLLDIAVRIGLVGLILFLSIIFVFGKMCWEIIRYARDSGIRDWGVYLAISFVAYFIIGLSEPVFLFKAPAAIFYIHLAMITILWRLNQDVPEIYDQLETSNKRVFDK
jgi:O-antigen ligase